MKDLKLRSVSCPFPGSLLVVPNDGKTHPGILALHGSEGGGFPAWKVSAMRWAAEGYAVLAYCYYGSNDGLTGPRQTLADIEVKDVLDALTWLKNSEYVGGKKMALDGTSRGGELALLAGSFASTEPGFSALDAISVHSPASAVWGPWNHDWTDRRCWLSEVPSYEELLNTSGKFSWNPKCGPDPRNLPENLRAAWKWKGTPLTESTRIEVEKIRCPVFLSQGLKDTVWPAEQAQEIEKTLKAHSIPHEVVFYENEGHDLGLDAAYDRQTRVLSFFEQCLGF
jgi:dipeptidyl aminopeptidase/acylaminoacyl peptidase